MSRWSWKRKEGGAGRLVGNVGGKRRSSSLTTSSSLKWSKTLECQQRKRSQSKPFLKPSSKPSYGWSPTSRIPLSTSQITRVISKVRKERNYLGISKGCSLRSIRSIEGWCREIRLMSITWRGKRSGWRCCRRCTGSSRWGWSRQLVRQEKWRRRKEWWRGRVSEVLVQRCLITVQEVAWIN